MVEYIDNLICDKEMKIYGPDLALSLKKEIWEERLYTKNYTVKKGDIVVDIGANIGVFSLFAAYCGAKVYALEPNPVTFSILKKNIVENNLVERVIPLNYAISDNDGFVTLEIPDSDTIYSLGSATIMKDVKNYLSEKQNLKFKSEKIEKISMETFCQKYLSGPEKINLLKVDCEGAEIQIFNQINSDTSKKILNIAMETHEGYLERDLVQRINNNGFNIQEYFKRTGHYQNGYCYANNKNSMDNNTKTLPVAILRITGTPVVDKPVMISSEESFILNNDTSDLKLYWNIDGLTVGENAASFYHTFSTPGKHTVKCTVSYDSDSDSAEENYTVFTSDYGAKPIDIFMGKEKEHTIAEIKDEMTFCIKKENLPKIWDFDSVLISIRGIGVDVSSFGGELISNCSINPINDPFSNIVIDSVRNDSDIIFSVKFKSEVKIEIKWWAQKKNTEQGHGAIKDDMGRYILGTIGNEKIFAVEKMNQFVIARQNLPLDWSPKFYKIGIAAVPTSRISGLFQYNDAEVPFSGLYKELKIEDCGTESGIVFSLFVSEKKNLKIVWWAQ